MNQQGCSTKNPNIKFNPLSDKKMEVKKINFFL